jgi:hypothetical protein
MVIGTLAAGELLACNAHPPDVSHERWLQQIAQWNKDYDKQQAAKAQAARETGTREAARGRRERAATIADDPAPVKRETIPDPQVRTIGRQPQSLAPAAPIPPPAAAPQAPASVPDARRARRYR